MWRLKLKTTGEYLVRYEVHSDKKEEATVFTVENPIEWGGEYERELLTRDEIKAYQGQQSLFD